MPETIHTVQGDITFDFRLHIPTITLWNRLEGRPRTANFNRALKAEVRDPLWMLSKQWQTGEFQGEDAGSAIMAKVHIKTTSLTKYQPGDEVTLPFDNDIPLEVKVENQKIPFQVGVQEISLDLRLLMGRQWLKMLKKAGFSLKSDYLAEYEFTAPDPDSEDDVQICAHVEVWQHFAAVASKSIDGYKLYQDFKSGTDQVDPPTGSETPMNALRERFIQWFEKLYYQPIETSNPSWKPSYLEHQFTCSAPEGAEEKVLVADEYYHGHLDWHNLDVHDKKTELPDTGVAPPSVENTFTLSFLPSPVTFPGMPHSRWWTLEDWKTNLGNINPNTTDLNQLMLLDFGLNYANDWLMMPFTLPVGSIANVGGVMVTNTFGENVWIEAAGKGDDEDWQRWSMFNLNVRGDMDVPADLSLLLLPAAPKILEGKHFEEVFMLRDEIANMVWGVESKVPLATGKSKSGKEAGIELRNKLTSLSDLALLKKIEQRLIQEIPGRVDLQEKIANIIYSEQNSRNEKLEILKNIFQKELQDEEMLLDTLLLILEPFMPQPLAENEAKIQYRLVNTVPEQWIPFIPVHKDADNRQIQIQRAAMPRILEGDRNTPKKIEPRTSILREGLDQPSKATYFIHEEEVPRSGIKVYKSFQRTRWQNGKVFTWVGFRKQVGRGEGHSGLAFDQILPKDDKKS